MTEPGKEETPSQEQNEEEALLDEKPVSETAPEGAPPAEAKMEGEVEPTPEPSEEPPSEPPKPQPESRSRRFLRLSIRWVAGLLIVFLLGVLAAGFLLYRPASQQLVRARQDLQAANQKIAQLEAQINDLQSQQQDTQALQQDLQTARTHIKLLSALSDVNAARVAMEENDQASAQAFLSTTPDTLSELKDMVSTSQADKVTNMQDRLKLALDILDSNPDQALSDLGVLAKDLVDLENILFASS
jgi:cytoskeletal protein RodZ